MNSSLTVFWPKKVAPEIKEIRFAYDFCRRLSEQLCQEVDLQCSWVEYTDDCNLGQILARVKGDLVLVVTDPEIVLSPSAVRGLIKGIRDGYVACGPVYNQTGLSHQRAVLPVPYTNIATYLEVAEALAERKNNRYIAVDALDPACVLYRPGFLEKINPELLVSEITRSIPVTETEKIATAAGALVHCAFEEGFKAERDDLVRLVPEGVKRVLDIGCAKGGYGKVLKQIRPEIYLTGVELNPIMAKSAERYYDEVIRCRLEDADLTVDFDLINCGDIIEHLQDPWSMLKRLHGLLRNNGYLVVSVPNVGHWTVVRDLLKGEFRYIPLGILCVTHLRWFTESSICQALVDAGFVVDTLQREQIPPTPQGQVFIQAMCASGHGNEESLRTNEFVIRAKMGIPRSRHSQLRIDIEHNANA